MNKRANRILLCLISAISATQSARGATFVSGTVKVSADSSSSSASITALPYVSPSMISTADSSSTATPDATGLVTKGTFSQSVSSASATASGLFEYFFTASAGDTYSLFGSAVPSAGSGSLSVFLGDDSNQTVPYSDYVVGNGPNTITADSSGGAMSGTLIAGDTYQFDLSMGLSGSALRTAGLQTNAAVLTTLTGSGGITITPGVSVPEPTGPVALVVGGALMLLAPRRRVNAQATTSLE